jgi:uncharacterized membrane protein
MRSVARGMRMMKRKAVVLLAFGLAATSVLTGGCSWFRAGPASPNTPAASTASAPGKLLAEGWRCEDGRTAGSRYITDTKALELRAHGMRRVLQPRPSSTGARFEDAEWLFWNRGAQALLQKKPAPPVYCTEVRALSLIEDARARGVTFRGRGNEPGWLLEVGPGHRVLLEDDHGGQRSLWPALAPSPGPVPGSTRYSAESDGRRYQITLLPDACVDDMSGERFTSSATIEIDGRRRRGCGTVIGE